MKQRSKSKENLSLVDKTAGLDGEKIAADWIESAHESSLNEEEFLKAISKEKFCKPVALFKQLGSIVRQKGSTCGAQKPDHQSWEDQDSSCRTMNRNRKFRSSSANGSTSKRSAGRALDGKDPTFRVTREAQGKAGLPKGQAVRLGGND